MNNEKIFLSNASFYFLTILIFGTACNGPVKKDLPKEKVIDSNITSVGHPKLIKTIGNPGYGNVQCGLQDKAGNLWFGTTENGLYKYDGKSFTQFLVTNGLNSNNISSILEDVQISPLKSPLCHFKYNGQAIHLLNKTLHLLIKINQQKNWMQDQSGVYEIWLQGATAKTFAPVRS